jgi:hypothetical protein
VRNLLDSGLPEDLAAAKTSTSAALIPHGAPRQSCRPGKSPGLTQRRHRNDADDLGRGLEGDLATLVSTRSDDRLRSFQNATSRVRTSRETHPIIASGVRKG